MPVIFMHLEVCLAKNKSILYKNNCINVQLLTTQQFAMVPP